MFKKLFVAPLVAALLVLPVVAKSEIDPKQFEGAIEKYMATEKGQVAIGKAVEEYFKRRQELARKEAEQRAASEMEDQFKNPVNLEIGSSPVKGPSGAKVTIIEFSDFQCPYCKRGRDTAEAVLKAYPNDVKLVFKNLPLPFHNQAMPAAKAALAAGKQGKFWEFHDALFDNQDKLSDSFYLAKAGELKLDIEKFKKDMASPEIEKQIKDEAALANEKGIQGTPGFFVGGVAVKGAYPVEHFKTIIDRLLGKSAA